MDKPIKVNRPSHLVANEMRRELEALNDFKLGDESIYITHLYFAAVYRYFYDQIEQLEIELAHCKEHKL